MPAGGYFIIPWNQFSVLHPSGRKLCQCILPTEKIINISKQIDDRSLLLKLSIHIQKLTCINRCIFFLDLLLQYKQTVICRHIIHNTINPFFAGHRQTIRRPDLHLSRLQSLWYRDRKSTLPAYTTVKRHCIDPHIAVQCICAPQIEFFIASLYIGHQRIENRFLINQLSFIQHFVCISIRLLNNYTVIISVFFCIFIRSHIFCIRLVPVLFSPGASRGILSIFRIFCCIRWSGCIARIWCWLISRIRKQGIRCSVSTVVSRCISICSGVLTACSDHCITFFTIT